MGSGAATPTIDAQTQAALARLTGNEKECLRRRLLQQTAKEMALELGVSPHAVEKRLKMARTKLGLSSSLEAARLLAAFEGYQRTGPQASDLSVQPPPAHSQSRRLVIIGSLVMIAFIAAAVVLATQTSGGEGLNGASSGHVPGVMTIDGADWERVPPEERAAFLTEAFARLDKDRSGYVEQAEVPGSGFRIGMTPMEAVRSEPDADEVEAGRRRWIAVYDQNDDRRISLDEYRNAFSEGETWRRIEPGRVSATGAEIVAISQTTFRKIDANRSGYLEGLEAPERTSRGPQPQYRRDEAGNLVPTGRTTGQTDEQARAEFYENADEDDDGRVSPSEFRQWLAPHLVLGGIPADARASLRHSMPTEG